MTSIEGDVVDRVFECLIEVETAELCCIDEETLEQVRTIAAAWC